jgi:hypothetical protein
VSTPVVGEGTEHPGCSSQGATPPSAATDASWEHAVGVPTQSPAPPMDHSHSSWAWQAVCVVSDAHVVIVPLQVDEVHAHPSSSSQSVSDARALHGVSVPVHVPVLHSQDSVSSHAASVAKLEHGDEVPVHVSVPAFHVQPVSRQVASPYSSPMMSHEYVVPVHEAPPSTQPWQYSVYVVEPQNSLGHDAQVA